MKIAFLTPEFPSKEIGHSGGIGSSIKNLANGLLRNNSTVIIIVYGQPQDRIFTEDGLTFYCVKNIKFKGFSLFLTQIKVVSLINSLFDQGKIDVLEAPEWTGFTSFIHPKCPIILRLHGSDTYFCYLENRPVKKINKFLEKRALIKANAIVSVSKFTGELTNKIFKLDRSFQVIPNSINYHDFEFDSTQNDSLIILYFGTLIRKKGVLELPLIFNKVHLWCKDVRLILVGKDAYDIKTNSKSTWNLMQPKFNPEAFKNVSYLGMVSHSEINSHIKNSRVCVFPSFAEALPVSWLEAMAMGKPVVASKIGWGPEVIEHGVDGFLEDPKKHEEYAQFVIELLNDNNLAEKIGKNARDKIYKKFSFEKVINQNLIFYYEVIKKHKKMIQ